MEIRVPNPASVRAAEYVRMSTEHQQYSIANQSAAIARYASARGMQIVRSFVDAGKSGLKLAGREGLQQLMEVVQGRQTDFDHILVYDVSRWGRFQDADESAFYEFICKRAGITVHYCAEPFANDYSVPSNLLKAIKRTMAGEYSRSLSSHTFTAQCRMARLGFRQGGDPGIGLRRQLIDPDGKPKMPLRHGERKSLQTDRVILVPGPPEEVAVVRRIFRLFTKEKWRASEIADLLNRERVKRPRGGKWTSSQLTDLLSHPKYVGVNVFNRSSFKLQQQRVNNPPEQWILRTHAFEPIIPKRQFRRAQEIIQERRKHLTDEEMLDGLRRLLAREGVLTGSLIDQAKDLLTSSAYIGRFGGLIQAWKMIGYSPPRDFSFWEAKRCIKQLWKKQSQELLTQLRSAGIEVEHDPHTGFMKINREFTACFRIVRCVKRFRFHWTVNFNNAPMPDVFIIGRMNSTNRSILDYFLFSSLELQNEICLLAENPLDVEIHRVRDLSAFVRIASRAGLAEAT